MENLASGVPVVQQFSFQRDRTEKLAVPNIFQGLVRPNISWHISVTDQQTFNSVIQAVAKMTFKETLGWFLWLKEGISSQGVYNVATIKCLYKTASW